MMLGAFTGYFRERKSTKNITFPYNTYVVYSRREPEAHDQKRYKLGELYSIASLSRDFRLLVQQKYRIASDRPRHTDNYQNRTERDAMELARLAKVFLAASRFLCGNNRSIGETSIKPGAGRSLLKEPSLTSIM